MVLKPCFLRGFKTLFFHRKTQGHGLKPYEKIGFSPRHLPSISAFGADAGALGQGWKGKEGGKIWEEALLGVWGVF